MTIMNARDEEDKSYIPSILVQCCLPQSDPGDIPVWTRHHKRLTISIQPYVDQAGVSRYPYGVFSRLLLYWVSWEAMQYNSRKIHLGKSFSDFVRRFGIATHGVLRDRLMSQMMRLFRCHIVFEQLGKASRTWEFIEFTSKGDLAWNEQTLTRRLTADSHIVLGERFFAAVKENPVPIDMRAIHGLKHSALALDLYTWASYRTFIESTKESKERAAPQLVGWRELMFQVGANYAKPRQFKAKIPRVLEQIRSVYPELQVDLMEQGLVVYASRPSVQIKEGRSAIEA